MSPVASSPGDCVISVGGGGGGGGGSSGGGGSMMELLFLLTNSGEAFFVDWFVRSASL